MRFYEVNSSSQIMAFLSGVLSRRSPPTARCSRCKSPRLWRSSNSVGPASIAYLLDLRRRIGPIGEYLDELYKVGKSAEIASLGEEIAAKGIFTPTDFMDADRLRALFVERIANMPAGTNAFAILPIGLLGGSYSILPELRIRGAEVTAIE